MVRPPRLGHSLAHLRSRYGKPAITLPREVIAYSPSETRVEVYPPVFRVFPLLAPDTMGPIPSSRVEISSLFHLSVLAVRAAASLQLPADVQYRVWNMPSHISIADGIRASDVERGTLVPIPLDSKTPISDFVKISDILAVEPQSSDGQWLLDAGSVTNATDTDADGDADTDEPLFPRNQDWLENIAKPKSPALSTESGGLQPSSRLKNTFSSLSFRGKSPVPAVQQGTMGLQNL
jgi:hypothetical protein